MIRSGICALAIAIAVAGCAHTDADTAARLHRKLAVACAIYEKPLVQLGLEFVPQAAAVKAVLDPYVMPLCRDILAVNDPAAPQWVMEQGLKVREAGHK